MYKPVPAICLVILLASTTAHAQETIFDPENPAVTGASDDDDAEETSEQTSDDGEETIFDPENPAVDAGEDEPDKQDQPRLEPVRADDAPPSRATFIGHYGTSLAVDTAWEGRGEDIVEWNNAMSLRLEYDMPGRSRAVIEGDFLHWMVGKENPDAPDYLLNASEGRASFEARLGEAYVLYRRDNWTFRVGNLVTPWGSTSIVRPGDVINPVDLTQVSTLTATSDLLLPQFSGEVSYSTPDWSVTGLVVPFFEPNDLVIFGRDVALLSPFNPAVGDQLPILGALERLIDPSRWDDVQSFFAATRVPDETPKNVSAGVRATATRWNTDFGLGYFYGWDRTPWIEVDPQMRKLIEIAVDDGQVLQDFDFVGFTTRHPEVIGISRDLGEKAADGETLIDSHYRRRHTVVADLARYVGPIGVRADVAFSPEQTLYTDNFEPLRRTTVFGALGLSWERIHSEEDLFAVTVEGFWLHPFARDSAVNEFFVAADERGPKDAELMLVGDDMYGAAGAVQWTVPLIDADLQLGVLSTFSNGDVVGAAALSRRWYSWLRTTLGVTVLEGPDPGANEPISLGGLYDHNDQVSLTVDGVF